jgi:tRNA (Thr-GGU) A37 N-methylase
VAELDVLDGTPLLDIKPYSQHDVFPGTRDGWLGAHRSRRTHRADGRFSEDF